MAAIHEYKLIKIAEAKERTYKAFDSILKNKDKGVDLAEFLLTELDRFGAEVTYILNYF